jgi:hypothetical protein
MNRRPLYVALILSALLLALHLYALDTYFYWYYRWFDIPMHILGGVAVGAFVLAFLSSKRMVLYFPAMIAVVVGWEVFEYIGRISTGQPDYWFDTGFDIVNGLVGAAITLTVAKLSPWRSN